MLMQLPINKWGNSKAVRLKNDLLEVLGWQNANQLQIETTPDGKAILSLAPSEDDGSLAYLFREYSDDGIREELIDFGESVGNEEW